MTFRGEQIRLAVIARFGKADATADYGWIRGREAIPKSLLPAAEVLATGLEVAERPVALVATLPEGNFLLRAYRRGMDSAFRPIDELEVATVEDDEPLSAEGVLALAFATTTEEALRRAGGEDSIQLTIPSAHQGPVKIDEDLLNRFRLGLPVATTDDRQALALLGDPECRLLGVVWARGRSPMKWSAAFSSLVGIRVVLPELEASEKAALKAVARRNPTDEEWSHLGQLEPERAQQVLRWAANEDGAAVPRVASLADPLCGWYVAFRRASDTGLALLKALREDLRADVLPVEVLQAACPGLSSAALRALAAFEAGERPQVSVEVLEELAAEDLLAQGSPVPPSVWMTRAGESGRLLEEAEKYLWGEGLEHDLAHLVLGLSTPESVAGEKALLAAETGRKLGLECPSEILRSRLESAHGPEDLTLLAAFGESFGGFPAALFGVAMSGQLPEAGVLGFADFLSALRARERIDGRNTVLPALSALVAAGRESEATGLLEALSSEEDSRVLSPTGQSILEARLGLGPPAPVASVAEVETLVSHGLARAGDVVPGMRDLRAVARLWPETEPLARLLGWTDPPPDDDTWPSAWLPALRESLTAETAGRWLANLSEAERPRARSWLCRVCELPPTLGRLTTGTTDERGIDRNELRGLLPWLVALSPSYDRMERRQLVLSLARAGTLRGDERSAERLVGELFPASDYPLDHLLVHVLSGIGPMPPIAGLPLDWLLSLVPILEPGLLVDSLFASDSAHLTRNEDLVAAVCKRVLEQEQPYPSHGFTQAQRREHPLLATGLARIPGWSFLALEDTERLALVRDLADRLGLDLAWERLRGAQAAAAAHRNGTNEETDE